MKHVTPAAALCAAAESITLLVSEAQAIGISLSHFQHLYRRQHKSRAFMKKSLAPLGSLFIIMS